MSYPQTDVLNSLRTSQFTLRRYVPALSPVDRSPERSALDLAIRNADRALWAVSIADGVAQSARVEIPHLRKALWTASLRPTVQFARKRLPAIPAVRALELPPNTASSGTLLLFAYALIAVIEQHAEAFFRVGLDGRVLPGLRSRSDALTTEVTRLIDSQLSGQRSRYEFAQALDDGRRAIALLHTRMLDQFSFRPDVLAAWNRAKRVRRVEYAADVQGRAA